MIQKVMKVGSSAAVTIPKKSLEELGLKIGDTVTLTIDSQSKQIVIGPSTSVVDREIVDWAKEFIERYRPALKALSKK